MKPIDTIHISAFVGSMSLILVDCYYFGEDSKIIKSWDATLKLGSEEFNRLAEFVWDLQLEGCCKLRPTLDFVGWRAIIELGGLE